jgi:hypothetical protein
VQSPACDLGQDAGDSGAVTVSSTNVLVGAPSVDRPVSPTTLDYTINLSLVPAGARIVRAHASYLLQGPVSPLTSSTTDDGGTGGGVDTSDEVEWSAGAVAALRAAATSSSFPIHSVCTFSPSPLGIHSSFKVQSFVVFWVAPIP